MKIGGVYAKPGIVNGKKVRRGDPIELDPKTKVTASLKDAAAKYSPDLLCYVTDVELEGTISTYPKGDQLKGKWENNTYKAKGKATLNRRSIAKDRVLSPVKVSFDITSQDTLDGMGQPEVEVVECKFAELRP